MGEAFLAARDEADLYDIRNPALNIAAVLSQLLVAQCCFDSGSTMHKTASPHMPACHLDLDVVTHV